MRDISLPVRSPYHEFILSEPEQAKRIHSLLENGRTLLEGGHTHEARRLFLQALTIYPHVVPALNNLALIALRDGDISRAVDIIHEAFSCDPNDPIAHSLAVQCYYYRESEPMVHFHVDATVSSFLRLVNDGDPVDPDYAERAFPFVFQALLIAEEDQGIIRVHEAVPDRAWSALELTWVGIAKFNRGRVNDAHIIWRRAAKLDRFEPAGTYATLAQHVLSEDLLPFSLDYELILDEDEGFVPYSPSSLTLARTINDVFRRPTGEAQALIAQLVEYDVPGQDYLLRRLLQNQALAPGVRMAAAIQLIWLGDDEPLAEKLKSELDPKALNAEDVPTYYLLCATLSHWSEEATSPAVRELVETGRRATKRGTSQWVRQCLNEFFDFEDIPGIMDDSVADNLDLEDTEAWDEDSSPFGTPYTEEPTETSDPQSPAPAPPRQLRSKRGGSNSPKR